MFSKFTLLVAAAFAASVLAGGPSNTEYTCNQGSLQCCGELQAPTSARGQKIAGLVNVPIEDLSGQLGAQCNPITAFGKGNGAGCASAPTCCKDIHEEQKALLGSVGVNCNPATAIV